MALGVAVQAAMRRKAVGAQVAQIEAKDVLDLIIHLHLLTLNF
jgi:hypothetical protein